jgi:Family of unknown function (DUF6502)
MSATAFTPEPDPTVERRSSAGAEQAALEKALGRLMDAVARLAVARGLPFAVVEEMLKSAFVQSAAAANPGVPAHRNVSRISTATGINRREVTRLAQPRARGEPAPPERGARSVASEVFAHWRSQNAYRDAQGEPLALPRQGAAPSFESLAQAVTRDVHPRSLLDELCRLALAQWDAPSDTVTLLRDAYVPSGDRVRMMGFLGENVGDHLSAAVDNVLAGDRMHFEQAVFADGLSAQSIASVRPAVAAHWQALLAALVPQLEAYVEADHATPPSDTQRLRVGLYTYYEAQPLGAPAAAPAPAPASAPAQSKSKSKSKSKSQSPAAASVPAPPNTNLSIPLAAGKRSKPGKSRNALKPLKPLKPISGAAKK